MFTYIYIYIYIIKRSRTGTSAGLPHSPAAGQPARVFQRYCPKHAVKGPQFEETNNPIGNECMGYRQTTNLLKSDISPRTSKRFAER